MVGENTGLITDELLTSFADAIGLNTTQFSQCLVNDTYLSDVDTANAYARESGVNSTPSFKVGDQIYSYTDMLEAINSAQ